MNYTFGLQWVFGSGQISFLSLLPGLQIAELIEVKVEFGK